MPDRRDVHKKLGKTSISGIPARASIVRFLEGMLRSVLVIHAAELLGVSRRTVYYWIRAGTLKTIRTRCGSRRVLMESIEALLRKEVGAVSVHNAGVARD